MSIQSDLTIFEFETYLAHKNDSEKCLKSMKNHWKNTKCKIFCCKVFSNLTIFTALDRHFGLFFGNEKKIVKNYQGIESR